jgi:hypothetical protein
VRGRQQWPTRQPALRVAANGPRVAARETGDPAGGREHESETVEGRNGQTVLVLLQRTPQTLMKPREAANCITEALRGAKCISFHPMENEFSYKRTILPHFITVVGGNVAVILPYRCRSYGDAYRINYRYFDICLIGILTRIVYRRHYKYLSVVAWVTLPVSPLLVFYAADLPRQIYIFLRDSQYPLYHPHPPLRQAASPPAHIDGASRQVVNLIFSSFSGTGGGDDGGESDVPR